MSGYGSGLFDNHQQMLAASGIPPERARARGYVSVDTKTRLEQLGVTKAGRNLPGLLVPSLRKDGSTWGYQYRPDEPRLRDGRPVKYETPIGQQNGLDVPPGVGPKLDDPGIPLWVTEGVKKADCAAEHGLACVALPGVWSWRGTNSSGGKTAIADWHDVALNDRRVVLAFDSDVTVKREVARALSELAAYLKSKGARVSYCHLPHDENKAGLDDYLLAGHTVADLQALVRPDAPQVVKPAPVEQAAPLAPVSQRGPALTGAAALDTVRAHLGRYICTVSDDDLDLLALWSAHTHLTAETYTTPRLVLDSPVPGSGKTTVLEHLERLCLHPVQAASLSSPALLTRMLEGGTRTLLIDEADRSLSPEKEGVGELLAVLNSGYKRGATRPVLVPEKGGGWVVAELPTYCPVAMAGNSPRLPEDTVSRTIRVLLLPDLEDRVEESDWERIGDDVREMGQMLADWATVVREQVRTRRPDLPEGIRGRSRERWAPLKRIADAAGGRWPDVVDRLAVRDKDREEADREDGMVRERPAVLLLRHLYELWPDDEPFASTNQLLHLLINHHPEAWGIGSPFGKPLTAQRLGRMLVSSYGINSTRLARDEPRGYTMASLKPVLRRMGVAPQPVEAAAPVTPTPLRETGASGAAGESGAPQMENYTENSVGIVTENSTAPDVLLSAEPCVICQKRPTTRRGGQSHAYCDRCHANADDLLRVATA